VGTQWTPQPALARRPQQLGISSVRPSAYSSRILPSFPIIATSFTTSCNWAKTSFNVVEVSGIASSRRARHLSGQASPAPCRAGDSQTRRGVDGPQQHAQLQPPWARPASPFNCRLMPLKCSELMRFRAMFRKRTTTWFLLPLPASHPREERERCLE